MIPRLPACALLATLAGALAGAEVHVLRFDLANAKASYVVSLPPKYDPRKRWPLILDLHGAIHPSRKGATLTARRLWSRVVREVPCIVVGANGRTRAWGMTRGEKNDKAYLLHVLAEVRRKYSIDAQRIYLAGFSSGSDYLCTHDLQLDGSFAASLVVCPGPPNVVGLKDGSLVRKKNHPFYFATGEEDYIRKAGAWEAFLALEKAGARVMYREVPRVGHAAFSVEEYARLIDYLDRLPFLESRIDELAFVRAAMARGDDLLASTHLLRLDTPAAKALLEEIETKGQALLAAAKAVDATKELGRAFEAWWRLRTQFHRFPRLAEAAQRQLDLLEKQGRGVCLRARRDWFRQRP